MKVFVTGVGGQLGHDVVNELVRRGIQAIGSDIAPQYSGIADGTAVTAAPYEQLDITDEAAVRQALTHHTPDAVIHCAAWTAVDAAEDCEEKVRAINAGGTGHIAKVCRALDCKMLYISTDYVFPGDGEDHYLPDSPTGPKGNYGRTKLAGELAVQAMLTEYFIVRISWVFGINGSNFVKTMLKLSETRDTLTVVCDQIGSPTYTADLAPLLCDMIASDKYGVYHATNEGECSWADFSRAIFAAAGKTMTVKNVTTAEYGAKAARPANSRMSKDKLVEQGFSRLPTWQDALARYLKELSHE